MADFTHTDGTKLYRYWYHCCGAEVIYRPHDGREVVVCHRLMKHAVTVARDNLWTYHPIYMPWGFHVGMDRAYLTADQFAYCREKYTKRAGGHYIDTDDSLRDAPELKSISRGGRILRLRRPVNMVKARERGTLTTGRELNTKVQKEVDSMFYPWAENRDESDHD